MFSGACKEIYTLGRTLPGKIKRPKKEGAPDAARLSRRYGRAPDVVVVGSALWDALTYRTHGAAEGSLLPPLLLAQWHDDLAAILSLVQVNLFCIMLIYKAELAVH